MAYALRFAGFLTLLALLALAGGCWPRTQTPEAVDVMIGAERFTLELALTAAQQVQGLSDRDHIAPDGGMLFVFDEARVRHFVMRRCLVPIDIIFLDPNGRIVAMHAMAVEPYDTAEEDLKRYSSGWPAQYAIELAGGWLDRLNLAPGQRIELPVHVWADRAGDDEAPEAQPPVKSGR